MLKNIIANFGGSFWSVLSNFLFIPLYIKYLGIENYSIISFTLVIAGILSIMDAGLTTTLSREFASSENDYSARYNIFKTLESCYFIIAAITIAVVFLSSSFIAEKWLITENTPKYEIILSLKIIAFEIGLRFLVGFYSGGLIGLNQQIALNKYTIFWGVFRNGLAVIPIYFYHSLILFFTWQLFITAIYTIILRLKILRHISIQNLYYAFFDKLQIRKPILKKIYVFASGMLLISIVSALNTQLDKLCLSKFLSIEVLGVYTLSFTIARMIYVISNPFMQASFPLFTSFYTGGKIKEAQKLYNQMMKIQGAFVYTALSIILIYGYDLLYIWNGDKNLSQDAAQYLPYIAVGIAISVMQEIPYNIARSNAYTLANNTLGMISLILTLPGYYILTQIYGAKGAAFTFSVTQLLLTIIYIYIINKRYIHFDILKTYINYFIKPLFISIIPTFCISKIYLLSDNRIISFIEICIIATINLCIVLLLTINKQNRKFYLGLLLNRIKNGNK